MELEDRIKAFSDLGTELRNLLDNNGGGFGNRFESTIADQEKHNGFFTPDNVRMAIRSIAEELTYENLKRWTDSYPALNVKSEAVVVGVIMAGNIPLAGFHDFLSVLISGNKVLAKTSSKDATLIVLFAEMLCSINSGFSKMISFTEGTISGFDAVIATGSDNSSRYFEYYFGRYPHIIRRNRNSVAIITGNETESELKDLGLDIFSYFGLGCRNISKVYVPAGYNFKKMIESWESFSGVVMNSKYANNYDYNMAIYLVNKEKFLETGFVLLRERTDLSSPISVLYYEFYTSEEKLMSELEKQKEKIQCIAGKNFTPFGKTQFPNLWDYADNVDTLEFLLKKKLSGIL